MATPLPTWKKLTLGLTVSFFVVIVGFGFLEGGLRLCGFGHSTAFFRQERDSQGRSWWRENRWVTAPYFPPELIRRPQSIRLPVEKAKNTCRIFVLGSSAAMGDPEPAFSISRQLDLLLSTAYPEIHFEVVNAGITAINSHVVRALARDCAKLQPDFFIVYEGNNEVIGPYGPGTVFSPFLGSSLAIRAGQVVKATRTGQLLASFARKSAPARKELEDWGGMKMFLKNEIDRDDPRLMTTYALFRENLRAIVQSGREAGARTLLCTVLTNQSDFSPFASGHRPGLTAGELAEWQAHFDAGEEGDLREALKIDDHFAELNFRLGRLCLKDKRTAEAKQLFQTALDLDRLRFRTDSQLNDVIRDLGREPGAVMVDLARNLEGLSKEGVPGDDFLYEHVHLNFQGTYLVAKELFGTITSELVKAGRLAPGAVATSVMPVAAMRQQLAYTIFEQAMIINEMKARIARPPFTAQSTNPARQKIYAERAEVARRVLEKPETRDGLVRIYERALSNRPDDWLLCRNTGMAFGNLGLLERAQSLLERAVLLIDDDPDSWFALATVRRKLGHSREAAAAFERVRALEPRYPGLPDVER